LGVAVLGFAAAAMGQDSARVVTARGDTVTVRDPTRNEDDIVSIGHVTYDVQTHEAVTTTVRTVFPSGGNRWIEFWRHHPTLSVAAGPTSLSGRRPRAAGRYR